MIIMIFFCFFSVLWNVLRSQRGNAQTGQLNFIYFILFVVFVCLFARSLGGLSQLNICVFLNNIIIISFPLDLIRRFFVMVVGVRYEKCGRFEKRMFVTDASCCCCFCCFCNPTYLINILKLMWFIEGRFVPYSRPSMENDRLMIQVNGNSNNLTQIKWFFRPSLSIYAK